MPRDKIDVAVHGGMRQRARHDAASAYRGYRVARQDSDPKARIDQGKSRRDEGDLVFRLNRDARGFASEIFAIAYARSR